MYKREDRHYDLKYSIKLENEIFEIKGTLKIDRFRPGQVNCEIGFDVKFKNQYPVGGLRPYGNQITNLIFSSFSFFVEWGNFRRKAGNDNLFCLITQGKVYVTKKEYVELIKRLEDLQTETLINGVK